MGLPEIIHFMYFSLVEIHGFSIINHPFFGHFGVPLCMENFANHGLFTAHTSQKLLRILCEDCAKQCCTSISLYWAQLAMVQKWGTNGPTKKNTFGSCWVPENRKNYVTIIFGVTYIKIRNYKYVLI